jgi:hypothetical protein
MSLQACPTGLACKLLTKGPYGCKKLHRVNFSSLGLTSILASTMTTNYMIGESCNLHAYTHTTNVFFDDDYEHDIQT